MTQGAAGTKIPRHNKLRSIISLKKITESGQKKPGNKKSRRGRGLTKFENGGVKQYRWGGEGLHKIAGLETLCQLC